jgi:hypothetical protein
MKLSSPFTPLLNLHENMIVADSTTDQPTTVNRGKPAKSAAKGVKITRTGTKPGMAEHSMEGRSTLLEFDRGVDLLALIKPSHHPVHTYSVFEKLHPHEDLCHNILPFPSMIRHLIYSFCFPEEDRKVSLSPRFATKAVFDDEYFASPWDILEPIWGGLSASQGLRFELSTYFWTEYHFYVSLNPFSGPKLSPLSHVWLPQYLGIIQHLTIEVDFTRFGGSILIYNSTIGHVTSKLKRLMVELVKGLQERPSKVAMAELVVLSRRYLSHRPIDNIYVTNNQGEAIVHSVNEAY